MQFKKIVLAVFVLLVSQIGYAQFDPKSPSKEPKTFSDKSYNFFLSKRLKTAIHQRDSLYDLVVAFNKDTTIRGKEYRYLDSLYKALTAMYNDCNEKNNALKAQFAEMNAKYNELMKKSLTDAERHSAALKIKGEELEAREKRLAELQSIINRQDSLLNALNDVVK